MPTPPLPSRGDDVAMGGGMNDDDDEGEGAEAMAQFDGADDDDEYVGTPPGSRVEGGMGARGVEVEVEAGVEVEDERDPGGGTAGESSSSPNGAKIRKESGERVNGGRGGGSGRRRTKRSWVHRYFSPMSGGNEDDDDGVACDLCSRDDKDNNDDEIGKGKKGKRKRTTRGGGRLLGVYSAGSSSTTLALHLRNVHDLTPPASSSPARKGGSDGGDEDTDYEEGTGRGRLSGMMTKNRKNERRGRPGVTGRRGDERIRRRGRRTRVAPPSVEQQSEESLYGSEASSSQQSDHDEEESGIERRSGKARRRGDVDLATSQRNEEVEHGEDDAMDGKERGKHRRRRRRRQGAKRSWVHHYFFRPADSDAEGNDKLNAQLRPLAAKAVVLCGLCRDADSDFDLDLSPDADGGSKRSKHKPRAGVYSAGSSLTTLASHLEKVHEMTEQIHNEGNAEDTRRLRRRRGGRDREREDDGGYGDEMPTRRRRPPHRSTRRDRIRRRSEGASSAHEGEDSTGEESAAAMGGREVAAGSSRKRSRGSTDVGPSREHAAQPEEDPDVFGDDADLSPTKKRRARGRGVGTRTKRSWVHHYFKPVVAAAGEDGEEEGSSAVTHVACDLCRASSSFSSEVTQVGRGTAGVYSVGSSNTTLASHLERVHSLTERMHRDRIGDGGVDGDGTSAETEHPTTGETGDGGGGERTSSRSVEGHRAASSTEHEEGRGWRSPPVAAASEGVIAQARGGAGPHGTRDAVVDDRWSQWVAGDVTRTPLRSAKARSWVHGYFQSINLVHRDAPTGKPHAVCGLCYPEPSIPHPSLFEGGRRRRGGRGRTGPNGTSNPLGVYSLGTSSSTFANHLERVHKLTERLHLANRARMRMSETAGDNSAANGGNGDRDPGGEEEDEDESDLLPQHQPLSEYDQAWLNVSYVENLVVRDQQPFTTSTRRGSQRFMRELNPRYVPCSASFVNWILDELHDLVVRVEGEMVSAGGTDAVAEAAQGDGGGIKKKRGRSSGVASSRLRSAMHSSTEQKLKNCRLKLHLLEQDLKNINRSRVADGGERMSWREYLSERLPYLQGKSKVKPSKRRPVTNHGKKCFV